MGGNVFTHCGLHTPRMPPQLYRTLQQDIRRKLQTIFPVVEYALDGPEKADYGDVDALVVAEDKTHLPLHRIAGALGAYMSSYCPGNQVLAFAIPWPGEYQSMDLPSKEVNITDRKIVETITASYSDPDLSCEASQKHTQGYSFTYSDAYSPFTTSSATRYTQLDVCLCTTTGALRWRQFMTSHGDFMNILASEVKSLGFTLTNKAMFTCISNVTENKKQARIFVSDSPQEVLEYFDLGPDKFWQPFRTKDEMMNLIASHKFHNPARFKLSDDEEQNKMTLDSLHAFDKRRYNSRPFFRYYYDVYLPAHENDPPGRLAHLTRAEAQEELFKHFSRTNLRERFTEQEQILKTSVAESNSWTNLIETLRNTYNLPQDQIEQVLRSVKRELDPSALRLSNDLPLLTSERIYNLTRDGQARNEWILENRKELLDRFTQYLDARRASEAEINPCEKGTRSLRPLEKFSREQDEVMVRMKKQGKTWKEIMAAVGCESKSQLMAHLKGLHIDEPTRTE